MCLAAPRIPTRSCADTVRAQSRMSSSERGSELADARCHAGFLDGTLRWTSAQDEWLCALWVQLGCSFATELRTAHELQRRVALVGGLQHRVWLERWPQRYACAVMQKLDRLRTRILQQKQCTRPEPEPDATAAPTVRACILCLFAFVRDTPPFNAWRRGQSLATSHVSAAGKR
jgi:hypothetical protein